MLSVLFSLSLVPEQKRTKNLVVLNSYVVLHMASAVPWKSSSLRLVSEALSSVPEPKQPFIISRLASIEQ